MVEQTVPKQFTAQTPKLGAIIELLKPITWFPPMWAYACGAISVGGALSDRWLYVLAGIFLAGPMVCGGSQAINDWFDRHVDAINEPDRVIPSGRMPGQWGLYVAIAMSVISLIFASFLGLWVLGATAIGVFFAWAYSAPPLRMKLNGWWGNLAVGLSYETLPWITAAAAALGAAPSGQTMAIAGFYGIGAHGIMTLNDFKAIKGDIEMGVRTLPVQLGVGGAARVACAVMVLSQLGVVAVLFWWGLSTHAMIVASLLVIQCICMIRFLRDPEQFAIWYSAIGVGLYVSGMMTSAFGLRALAMMNS